MRTNAEPLTATGAPEPSMVNGGAVYTSVHLGGAFAVVVKSNITRSPQRLPDVATARRSAVVPFFAVTIGSVVPTPGHATVVVVTGAVVDVVAVGPEVVVVVDPVVVDGTLDTDGLSDPLLLHPANRATTTADVRVNRRMHQS